MPYKYAKILSVRELGFKLSGFHTIDSKIIFFFFYLKKKKNCLKLKS